MAAKKKTPTKRYANEAPHRVGIQTRIARELDALRKVDPGQWRDKVLNAFRQAEGHAGKTAELLSIGRRTLTRYMSEDESLGLAMEKIRTRVSSEREAKRKADRKAAREAAKAGASA